VLPTILRLLGGHMDALTLPRWRDPKRLAVPSRPWRRLGRLVTDRPIPVATLVVALTITVATPISRVHWTTVDASSLPTSAQAFQADRAINRSREFVHNGGTPFYLALKAPPAAGAAAALADRARRVDGVLAVAPPRFLGADTWQINLIAAQAPYRAVTQNLVHELNALRSAYPIFVGGDAAAFHDERNAIGAHLPLAIALLSQRRS
jgi:uncharacterized membrane protein YdfJ with MMPL/SSD domain